MTVLALSGDFSLHLVNVLAAVWFLAVGYLFYKNLKSRLSHTSNETSSVTAALLEPSERALLRG